MGSTRRSFTAEYKAAAVSLVLEDSRSIVETASNIGVHEVTVGKWVKKAKDEGKAQTRPFTEGERAELEKLRAENSRLRMEVEFAKKSRVLVPTGNVIFHSDRGTQYTSEAFDDFCRENNILRSVGRTGICYDNAVAESFFATYKKELIHAQPWVNLSTLRKETFLWIEHYYNRQRRHSSIGYLTPAECDSGKRTLQEIAA